MAKAKKNEEVVENPVVEETQASNEHPDFKGDAKAEYLDINNPDHGNKTYVELQREANEG